MRRTSATLLFGIVLSCSAPLRAQTEISALVSKNELSNADTAAIADWCDTKARALQVAGERNDPAAVDKVIGEMEKIAADKAATPRFREVFGEQCGRALAPLAASGELTVAIRVTLLMQKIPVAGTRDALIAALGAPQAAVRYAAAAGLKAIQPALKSAEACRPMLEALAQAGAAESERYVLQKIYAAIDFDVGDDFTGQDAVAEALVTVLTARLQNPGAVMRSAGVEEAGFTAVARLAPRLKERALQARLVGLLARFLAIAVNRYVDQGPSSGASLADICETIETALAELVTAGEGSPPAAGSRVAARMRAKGDAKAVRAAMAGWVGGDGQRGVLNGKPWDLPVGLRG